MSTEHQRYSIEGQSLTNAAYALTHGYEIVETFVDSGVSGLTLSNRDGLKALIARVVAGAAEFEAVLVYDVSRWGRFQDPDQAAHYEFICRDAGVHIEYTAELFENDGSLPSTLAKHMKRAMAAEFSRELSAKVRRAQDGLRAKGYWMGGPCGYGLRRQLVGLDGVPGAVMAPLERKALQGYRTILVHGPPEEVATVRRIFRMFVIEGLRTASIAKALNSEGRMCDGGSSWTTARVASLLKSERYAGVLVGRRQVYHLRTRRNVPRADWVRVENAIPPIVSRRLFNLAQSNLEKHKAKATDDALIAELRGVLKRCGRLSHDLIDRDAATHCSNVYKKRFGGLIGAYARVGYEPTAAQRRAARLAAHYRPHEHRKDRKPVSQADLIRQLVRLLAVEGALSVALINEASICRNAEVYRQAFGGMRRAYALAGYVPSVAQERALDRQGGQSVDRAGAADIRRAVLSRREQLGGNERAEQQDRDNHDPPAGGAGLEPAPHPDEHRS